MTPYDNIIPIRRGIEDEYRFSRDLARVLEADADQIRDDAYRKGVQEGRDRGRIEGSICMALVAVLALTVASFWTI